MKADGVASHLGFHLVQYFICVQKDVHQGKSGGCNQPTPCRVSNPPKEKIGNVQKKSGRQVPLTPNMGAKGNQDR
jgi:hypothetical protein